MAERTLMGMGRAEEIARVTAFLASGEASYPTGDVVNVNGSGSFG